MVATLMKKLLAILVISLLWCNVGFAETRLDCKYYDSIRITHTETSSTYSGELKNIIQYMTIILDLDKNEDVLGIEIINVSELGGFTPEVEALIIKDQIG